MPDLREGLTGKYVGYETELLGRVDSLRAFILERTGLRKEGDVFNYLLRRGVETVEAEKKAPRSE